MFACVTICLTSLLSTLIQVVGQQGNMNNKYFRHFVFYIAILVSRFESVPL